MFLVQKSNIIKFDFTHFFRTVSSTPNLEHKVPKRSRWLIFSLFLVIKIAKGKENIPAFAP